MQRKKFKLSIASALVVTVVGLPMVLSHQDVDHSFSVTENTLNYLVYSVANNISTEARANTVGRSFDLQDWKLPDIAPSPGNNKFDKRKFELGKKLFFDPRLSGNGKMSCATCHNPQFGWSDGMPTARGHEGKVLGRATPTIINVGFNKILMWDGRAKTLEHQALGPITNPDEMANSKRRLIKTLKGIPGYVKLFKEAFWGLDINTSRVANSIAMFQRKVVVNNSPFDRWIRGDKNAMSKEAIRGFEVFNNPNKGNCSTCHRPPNFTDDGFHNIGLASFGKNKPDMGRYNQKRAHFAKGAFKTPPLRNVSETAPYFHDGSAKTLKDVVIHYNKGGIIKTNLSPNMKQLSLSEKEMNDLVEFLKSLTGKIDPSLSRVDLPN